MYYLRDPAAKDNSITHAAAARSNLDAAITMRSAEIELQNTIELRATASETAPPKPDWPCVCLFSPFCFVCFLASLAILGCDDTMLPSPAWIHQWTGCQSFLCVRFWLVLVLLFGFVCCLVLFCVSLLFAWFMMMTAQWTMYRSSPSSLLRPSTVDGLEH